MERIIGLIIVVWIVCYFLPDFTEEEQEEDTEDRFY